MKLIDLLLEELGEWPKGCHVMTQDRSGCVYYWRKTPTFIADEDSWEFTGRGGTVDALLEGTNYYIQDDKGNALEFEACTDYHIAIINQNMYEAAMKELTDNPKPAGGLIEWRDRVIEIQKEQLRLQQELRELHTAINKSGFKLDLAGLN